MRRPALLLSVAAATLLLAAPLGAQRTIRRAFEPAITPFVGASNFDTRVRDSAGATFDYNNGIAFGVQLDHPLTRRAALIGTLALTPVTHVDQRVEVDGGDATFEHGNAVVAGLDAGFAGRLKPSAALFGYVGGGLVLATRPPVADGSGMQVDPRATIGVGLDLARRASTGVRVMFLQHLTFPRTSEPGYEAESVARDWTFVLGGRFTLGAAKGTETAQ